MNASDVEWPTCQDKLRSLEAETVTAEITIETEKTEKSKSKDSRSIPIRKKSETSRGKKMEEATKGQKSSNSKIKDTRFGNGISCQARLVRGSKPVQMFGRKVGDREVSRSLLVLGCQEKTDKQMFGAQVKSRWFPNLLQGRKWIHPLGWSTSSYRAQFLSAVIDLAKGWMTQSNQKSSGHE